MFPFAYHIKVIVRDGSAVWSSGNLNNSNQPDLGSPPKTEDRDWHVIIEDAQLSKIFSAYLDQDYASAIAHQSTQPSALASAISDVHAKIMTETNPVAVPAISHKAELVAAKVFPKIPTKLTPLLTPDTLPGTQTGQYLTNIIDLIKGAKRSLYIQLQYIEASNGTGDYDRLLKAIADRAAAGVEVHLIESLEYGEKWAEKMKSQGVDLTANISLQSNVHNKGFVVDSTEVVVSSQNFSPAGVQDNRDAGVIIDSAPIAGYFEKVFLSDLKTKAKPFNPKAAARLVKSAAGKGLRDGIPHSGRLKVKVRATGQG
jgi:phosphatidylserine/phosphatidylglycerophosphate/cardiolipin synthase-like enzyme